MILLAEHDEPLLAAKKKRQVAASESLTSTPKNRVWGFENTPSGRPVVEPPLSSENATGSVQYTYQIASGRAEWLSRDRLGERGGLNLYGYVGNDGVNGRDPSGLCCEDARQNVTDATNIVGLAQNALNAATQKYQSDVAAVNAAAEKGRRDTDAATTATINLLFAADAYALALATGNPILIYWADYVFKAATGIVAADYALVAYDIKNYKDLQKVLPGDLQQVQNMQQQLQTAELGLTQAQANYNNCMSAAAAAANPPAEAQPLN